MCLHFQRIEYLHERYILLQNQVNNLDQRITGAGNWEWLWGSVAEIILRVTVIVVLLLVLSMGLDQLKRSASHKFISSV